MLKLDEGKKAVVFARNVIEEYIKNNSIPNSSLDGPFIENQGAFVTIHTYPNHDLRGCIGIPLPVMSLNDAIIEGALHKCVIKPLKQHIYKICVDEYKRLVQ